MDILAVDRNYVDEESFALVARLAGRGMGWKMQDVSNVQDMVLWTTEFYQKGFHPPKGMIYVQRKEAQVRVFNELMQKDRTFVSERYNRLKVEAKVWAVNSKFAYLPSNPPPTRKHSPALNILTHIIISERFFSHSLEFPWSISPSKDTEPAERAYAEWRKWRLEQVDKSGNPLPHKDAQREDGILFLSGKGLLSMWELAQLTENGQAELAIIPVALSPVLEERNEVGKESDACVHVDDTVGRPFEDRPLSLPLHHHIHGADEHTGLKGDNNPSATERPNIDAIVPKTNRANNESKRLQDRRSHLLKSLMIHFLFYMIKKRQIQDGNDALSRLVEAGNAGWAMEKALWMHKAKVTTAALQSGDWDRTLGDVTIPDEEGKRIRFWTSSNAYGGVRCARCRILNCALWL